MAANTFFIDLLPLAVETRRVQTDGNDKADGDRKTRPLRTCLPIASAGVRPWGHGTPHCQLRPKLSSRAVSCRCRRFCLSASVPRRAGRRNALARRLLPGLRDEPIGRPTDRRPSSPCIRRHAGAWPGPTSSGDRQVGRVLRDAGYNADDHRWHCRLAGSPPNRSLQQGRLQQRYKDLQR